jgi:hypothetical protein
MLRRENCRRGRYPNRWRSNGCRAVAGSRFPFPRAETARRKLSASDDGSTQMSGGFMVARGRTIARQGQLSESVTFAPRNLRSPLGEAVDFVYGDEIASDIIAGSPPGRDDFANYGAVLRLNLSSESSLWHSNARHFTPHSANLNLPVSARHFGCLTRHLPKRQH